MTSCSIPLKLDENIWINSVNNEGPIITLSNTRIPDIFRQCFSYYDIKFPDACPIIVSRNNNISTQYENIFNYQFLIDSNDIQALLYYGISTPIENTYTTFTDKMIKNYLASFFDTSIVSNRIISNSIKF